MRITGLGRGVFAAVLAFGAASSAGAAVVYDSTTTNEDFVSQPVPATTRVGDDVTLAGTDRRLTEFFLPVYSFAQTWTGTVTATFYNNDGTGGAPGSVLWTATQSITNGVEGIRELTFTVSDFVLLPDTFTWAFEQSTTAGDEDLGPIVTDLKPAVGDSDDELAWFFDGVEWTPFDYQSEVPPLAANFEARITAGAVPEPGTAAALGLAGMMGLGLRRRK